MRGWLARIAAETGSTAALSAFGTTTQAPAPPTLRWRHCGQEQPCHGGQVCACGKAVKDETNGDGR